MQAFKSFIMRPGMLIPFIILMMTQLATQAQEIHGFRLKEKRFVREVNAECFYYEHVKSGAKLFKIAGDDANKTFAIAFKTFPESDNGIAHIMEHSVLNGSVKFPVKSPFDVLSKGSLKTFLNAFTSKDMTIYPVASMNDKDYFNLMLVYLDAVFNPLIYTDERILKQEGWHYELNAPEEEVIYKGVVYNEMKGSFSNPDRELYYQLYRHLFPDNAYGNESGGYPDAIPELTNETFLNFHKRNYHPGNSYIFLYGNADINKELQLIDSAYLSNYGRLESPVTIQDQKAFREMKLAGGYYPVMEGENTTDKTYLSIAFVAGHNTDPELVGALGLICDLLVNQETAPLRLALQEAGIGQDIYAGIDNIKQNVVQITVQNANPGDRDKFMELFRKTLQDVISKGFDKDEVKGLLNRLEFQMREGNDAQKGLRYMGEVANGWIFADDPFRELEYEKTLAGLKQALSTQYLEKIARKYLLENPHSLLFTMEPKAGLDKERHAKTTEKLRQYKASLSAEEKEKLIKETRELIEYQKREDDPAALATIPLLSLSDVNPTAAYYSAEALELDKQAVLWHKTFTNGIAYLSLHFDLRQLPQDLIPYASMLCDLSTLFDTEKHTYGEVSKLLNMYTGGFNTKLQTYLENYDDDRLVPKFAVTTKVMPEQLDNMFGLTQEILLQSKFTDKERLKTLLTRLQSQLDANAKRDGIGIAMGRIQSYFSKQGLFREITGGLDYYWFVTDLSRNFEQKAGEISSKLRQVSEMLFTRENCTVSFTGTEAEMNAFRPALQRFTAGFRSAQPMYHGWNLKPEKKNEGIITSSKVQYVVEGYNFRKLGYGWDGKLRVLNQVLSSDWLQNQVRVIGGAYGGFSRISPDGTITFNSYRDPNLKETLDAYKGTVQYLQQLSIDQTELSRYIIGTISGMDRPLTPAQQGEQAVANHFTGRTAMQAQKDRDAVLSTTLTDLRNFSKLVSDVLATQTVCVYGNSEKITASGELFGKMVKIERD